MRQLMAKLGGYPVQVYVIAVCMRLYSFFQKLIRTGSRLISPVLQRLHRSHHNPLRRSGPRHIARPVQT